MTRVPNSRSKTYFFYIVIEVIWFPFLIFHYFWHSTCLLSGIVLFVYNVQRMAFEVYHQAIGVSQSHSCLNNFSHHQKIGNNLVRRVTKDFISSNCLSRTTGSNNLSAKRNCVVIRSSASQKSVFDRVSSPSRNNTSDTHNKKSSKTNSVVS